LRERWVHAFSNFCLEDSAARTATVAPIAPIILEVPHRHLGRLIGTAACEGKSDRRMTVLTREASTGCRQYGDCEHRYHRQQD
jgi:hypothetical protein